MKPFDHFIPSLLLLMAVAFGAPQSSDHNLLLNETVDASYSRIGMHGVLSMTQVLTLTGIYDLVLNYTDLMSDPEPGDRFANVSAPISAFTGLSTVPITGSHGVIIRMGTSKQHIGELNKQRMWDTIHNSLMQLCPIERGQIGCYKDMPGARNPESFYPPNPEYLTYYKRISIGGIPYKDDKGNYATNARLIITMEGMFRERNFPGLAAATVKFRTSFVDCMLTSGSTRSSLGSSRWRLKRNRTAIRSSSMTSLDHTCSATCRIGSWSCFPLIGARSSNLG